MDNIFTLYLHAGLLGGVIILLILLLRLLLRKAPRNVLCILWLLAAVRLLLPVQLSSPVSLQPDIASNIVLTVEQSPAAPVTDQQPNISVTPTPAPAPSAQQTPNYGKLLSGIWLIGIGIMLLYAFGSYLSFKHKVRNSALQPDGTEESFSQIARHLFSEKIGVILISAGRVFITELQCFLERSQGIQTAVRNDRFGFDLAGSNNSSFKLFHYFLPPVICARISSSV